MVFLKEKGRKNELKNSPLSQIALKNEFDLNDYNFINRENDDPNIINNDELKSRLKPEETTQDAPIGSPEFEDFLQWVDQKLITVLNKENYALKKRQ